MSLDTEYFTIELTKGFIARVSPQDFDWLCGWRWKATLCDKSFYASRSIHNSDRSSAVVRMHVFIMNPPKGFTVDHINKDTLDNRRDNLRICTRSQNNMNRGMSSHNTSGYKGVSWHRHRGDWHAYIRKDGIMRHLGYHPTAIQAALAYDKEALQIFGEFAVTNAMLGLL